jgi:hypothetical protein
MNRRAAPFFFDYILTILSRDVNRKPAQDLRGKLCWFHGTCVVFPPGAGAEKIPCNFVGGVVQ